MNFDINEVIADMASAIEKSDLLLNQNIVRIDLKYLLGSQLTIDGDLNFQQLESFHDGKLLAEAELHVVAIITIDDCLKEPLIQTLMDVQI